MLRLRYRRYTFLLSILLITITCLKLIQYKMVPESDTETRFVFPPVQAPKSGELSLINVVVSKSSVGEDGKAFPYDRDSLDKKGQNEFDEGHKMTSFNKYASDRISLLRRIPDNRFAECKRIVYPVAELPDASIIICFHNEALSTLLRTVYSVLDRTPLILLHEIILVDDGSTHDFLKSSLQIYIDKAFSGKVKIVRTIDRVGLIKARLIGADAATGGALIFLDSHCEATEGWITPLLNMVHNDESTIVAPNIISIDDKTLRFVPNPNGVQVGGFTWNLVFTWHVPTEFDLRGRTSQADPVRTPTIAGGLFAISRNHFIKLGKYDPGMDIWGAENLEISFRNWMCHGSLYIHPCSMVGHIFRSSSPYQWRSDKDVYTLNNLRLAHTWMDEYKKYYLYHLGDRRNLDYGDISERLEIRERLKCHSFDWYIENVYPSIFNPKKSIVFGEIRNVQFGMCLDASDSTGPLKIYNCHGMGGNQMWYYSNTNELRGDDHCIDIGFKKPSMESCHGDRGNQELIFNSENNIVSSDSSTSCLAISEDGNSIGMEKCGKEDRFQWKTKIIDI